MRQLMIFTKTIMLGRAKKRDTHSAHLVYQRLASNELEKVRVSFSTNNQASIDFWRNISVELASNASGEIRVVLGSKLRPQGIWATYELPALKNNKAVSKIISVDPQTGQESLIFERGNK